MAFDPIGALFSRTQRSEAVRASDGQETSQRLQVGFFGLGAMILLVGLANVIMNSVQQTQATAVPEAAPTMTISPEPLPAVRDPLADAGVVPDLPAEPEAGDGTGSPITVPAIPVPRSSGSPRP